VGGQLKNPLKEKVEAQWQWSKELLPLIVLYSPLLRLRFRSALTKVANKVNEICGCQVLASPREAPNSLAVAIEAELETVNCPGGVVYVRDCETRKDTDGHVFFYSMTGPLYAVVMLPENENSPYSTVEMTTKEVLRLLLVPVEFGSVFSEKVVDFLKKEYGRH
jgi:hypothetical protein